MQVPLHKPVPPRRDSALNTLWRWFWRGLLAWSLIAAGLLYALAGGVAPLLREGRHLLVGVGSAVSTQAANTADFAAVAHTSENLFGVNTFLYQEVEEAKIRRSLSLVKAAGFGFIREQVAWQEFERGSKGNYWDERWNRSTWTNLDRLVDLVEEAGLQMIARVDYPPDWALPPGNTWHASPPARLEDYGDFVHTLASRYRGRLRYYQVWNEPNLTIEWGMKNVDPAEYTRLLKVGFERIKQADPDAVVIAAALAPTIEKGPQNMNDLLFLRRMYEAGAKGYFDIASLNPYGLRSGPDDRRATDEDTNFSRPIRAREIMVEFGDESTPIWASETGWCALPADYPYVPLYGRATKDQQARYTFRVYERVQQEWPWLGMMSLWHFRMVDNRLATQQPYYFGIVSDDFAPEPVYEALAAMASRAPLIYPGFRQEDHRAVEYSGDWQVQSAPGAALGSYTSTDVPGASASFRFWGTALDLVVARGPAAGTIKVSIDGGATRANLLSRDRSGSAVADLRAETDEYQVRLPVSRGLPAGEHEVEVTLLSGALHLDGVLVQADDSQPPNPLGLMVALGLGLFLFTIWARSGNRGQR